RQACADRRRFGRYRQDCSCCTRLVTERAFRHRLRETDGTPAGRHLHHRGIARYMDLFSMGHRFGVPAADPPRRGLTKKTWRNTMLTRRHLLATAGAIAAAATLSEAAAENYANQPIHILVGYAAGGGVDIVARLLQEPMKVALRQPIVIENRTGASAMLATVAVAKAPPDGYTLLMAASGEVAINHFLFKEKMSYDPVKELVPIAMIGIVPCV